MPLRMNAALRAVLYGLVVAVVRVLAGSFAHAADVEEGRRLAQNICSRCHAVTIGKSPRTAAPSFAAIANKPGTTSASLEAFIVEPQRHPKMSPLATRNPSEAANLAVYIMSLKRK